MKKGEDEPSDINGKTNQGIIIPPNLLKADAIPTPVALILVLYNSAV